MPAINAPNINTWNGERPIPPPVQEGYLPDPGTGSTNFAGTPMQDDERIYTSIGVTPAHAPPITTLPYMVDDHEHGMTHHDAGMQAIPFIV